MIFAIALGAAALATRPTPAPAADTVRYTVRRGDTLEGLCTKYLVPQRRWQALRKLARVGDPHFLPVARVLVIPRDWLRFTVEPAQLASYRGTIAINAGGRAATVAVGLPVSEGAEISTAANSFATLLLADRSKIVVPSDSRITIVQLRRILLTGAIDYRISVARGRLETKVTPIDNPQGRYRIGTPISMTAVRGTEFRVGFDGDNSVAAAEVLTGTVAVSPPGGEQPVLVEHAFGATTDRTGASRIEPLLPAPDLIDPGKVQSGDAVTFHAAPVPGATHYRAVIASDAGFVENIAGVDSDTPDLTLADVPNGNQFVRISAIARSGLQGLAQAYGFRRQLASIHGEAAQGPDGFRFRWFGAGGGKRFYRFQLMRGATDSAAIIDETGLSTDSLTLRDLPPGIYYWRVGLTQIDDSGEVATWTDPEKLTVGAPAKGRGGN